VILSGANKTRLISVGEVEVEAVEAEGRKSPLIRIVLLGLVSPLLCLSQSFTLNTRIGPVGLVCYSRSSKGVVIGALGHSPMA